MRELVGHREGLVDAQDLVGRAVAVEDDRRRGERRQRLRRRVGGLDLPSSPPKALELRSRSSELKAPVLPRPCWLRSHASKPAECDIS